MEKVYKLWSVVQMWGEVTLAKELDWSKQAVMIDDVYFKKKVSLYIIKINKLAIEFIVNFFLFILKSQTFRNPGLPSSVVFCFWGPNKVLKLCS